jgi:cytochrome c biogenesis protein CcmG/thiol:disulfide interchange protein DsbE
VGCRHEHDFLLTLAAREDIPIYGLNWRDDRDAALLWLRQLGDPYAASAYDADGTVGIDWGVYGAPETFLIGPDGTVLHKHLSPLTEEIWQRDFVPKIEAVRGN